MAAPVEDLDPRLEWCTWEIKELFLWRSQPGAENKDVESEYYIQRPGMLPIYVSLSLSLHT